MKIAIITGHFMPEIGYQEVYLARALSKLANEVCVFTSNKISPSKRKVVNLNNFKVGISREERYKYKIHRLKTSLSFGASVLCKSLKSKVLEYEPDLIIVLGVGKFFPFSIFNLIKTTNFKVITFMGNNRDYYNWNSFRAKINSIKNILTLKTIKKWVYRRAIKYSNNIFVYTNDTEEIVNSLLSEKLKKLFKKKIVNTTLGFDADEFYFDDVDYYNIRKQYKIPVDSIVIVTSTRVNRNKKLELIIDSVSKIQDKGLVIYYFIIGFMNDEYEKELKEYVKSKEQDNKFICLPFLDHEKIRQIYCASDIGIWIQAAISIQESMGTGLPVLLENKGSVNHLVKECLNGWLFEKSRFHITLKKILEKMKNSYFKTRIKDRKKVREFNYKRFSYDRITKDIIKKPLNSPNK